MSRRALQEPAILSLIFPELGQFDLLRIQKVCRTWRGTIVTSKVFLKKLYLHPGPDPVVGGPGELNPFLDAKFESFFSGRPIFWDQVPGSGGSPGPWWSLARHHWSLDLHVYTKFRHPEASWRRMIPWLPAPIQLQIHVEDRDAGAIARLNFDNKTTWVTFGLIHDIVENAWFRGEPWSLSMVHLKHPGVEPRSPIPRGAVVPDRIADTILREPGRINLNMTTDDRSQDERTADRNEAIADYEASRERQQKRFFRLCGFVPPRLTSFDKHMFTNEFHLQDSLSFADIEWDEVYTYHIPPVDPLAVAPVRREPTRRRFLGLAWGRRR